MNNKAILMVVLMASICALTSSCSRLIEFSPPDNYYSLLHLPPHEMDDQAKKMVAPADKALVYLYRNLRTWTVPDAFVHLDDKPAGQLAAGTYLLWQLVPGTHTVKSHFGKVTLDTKAGTTYYIRLDVKFFTFFGGTLYHSLQLVDNEEGRKDVEELLLMSDTPQK